MAVLLRGNIAPLVPVSRFFGVFVGWWFRLPGGGIKKDTGENFGRFFRWCLEKPLIKTKWGKKIWKKKKIFLLSKVHR